ncbi:MAG: hypothetical protein V3W14_06855 [Candidatus Neomarinimicrobiota bacterium]
MGTSISSIIGMPISTFLDLVEEKKKITVRRARLIPIYKAGDEMALTSLFLSALRLVKEFRNEVFSTVTMSKSGKMHVFTEPNFAEFEGAQPDGLILIVGGGKIKDAALLEMKNKKIPLSEDQISRYLNVAKQYKIPKVITVSNQFVSIPTQSPINVKVPKNVSLYHLSWSYILTIAHILLVDNENNIADADQVEIMKEVVDYLEHDISGVLGFTEMKAGWKEVVNKINMGSALTKQDPDVLDTVSSWLQEERDMALILSRELGLLVKSGMPKFRYNLPGRINNEIKNLIESRALVSTLQISGAASDISVIAHFERRNIEMNVSLLPPQDKKLKGQIGWLRRQLELCERKNADGFDSIRKELGIDIELKYQKLPVRYSLDNLEDACDDLKGREIKRFEISQIRDLGRKFESKRGIVQNIEGMLLDYYRLVVQHLKKWEKPAPKMLDSDREHKDLDSID